MQGVRAWATAMVSMVFYLTMEKVWNFRLLATPWYAAQPLLVKLVTMQVRARLVVLGKYLQKHSCRSALSQGPAAVGVVQWLLVKLVTMQVRAVLAVDHSGSKKAGQQTTLQWRRSLMSEGLEVVGGGAAAAGDAGHDAIITYHSNIAIPP